MSAESVAQFQHMIEVGGPHVWDLLGCRWGVMVGEDYSGQETEQINEPCKDQATRILVLHYEGQQMPVKLCEEHHERMLAVTTPHGDGA